jgi:hypothetical protein
MRKLKRVSSANKESQMRRTSGNGNSCDKSNISHLTATNCITPFYLFIVHPATNAIRISDYRAMQHGTITEFLNQQFQKKQKRAVMT